MKSKTAILCRGDCKTAVETMHYFSEKGRPIALVVLETGNPKKTPKNMVVFHRAHARYELFMWKKRGICENLSSLKKFLYFSLPGSIRNLISPLKNILSQPGCSKLSDSADKLGVEVVEVGCHSSEKTLRMLLEHNIGYVFLASTASLIKEPLLSSDSFKIINLHPGVLPKHRSLDSMAWSILEGDPLGLSAHFVDGGVDTGPILKSVNVETKGADDLLKMSEKMDDLKPILFYDVVCGLESGEIKPIIQDPSHGVHHRPMNYAELIKTHKKLKHI